MNRTALHSCWLALALAALSALPADASSWQVRSFVAWVEPGDGFEARDGADFIRSRPEASWGFGAAADYRLSRRFGLGLTALWSDVEIDTDARVAALGGSAGDRGDLGVQIYSLGLDLHLTPGRAVELVLTPAVAFVDYDDLAIDLGDIGIVEEITFDDEVTAALGLRADLLRGRWLMTGGISYIETTAEAVAADVDGQTFALELDPLVISLGIGYRF